LSYLCASKLGTSTDKARKKKLEKSLAISKRVLNFASANRGNQVCSLSKPLTLKTQAGK